MSVQAALHFIQTISSDNTLADTLYQNQFKYTLDDLADLSADSGFNCSTKELQQAFALDWQARYHLYAQKLL